MALAFYGDEGPWLLPLMLVAGAGGGLIYAAIPAFLRNALANFSDYHLLLFGAVMVIMMLYRPQGLLGSSRRKEEILNP